MSADAYDLAAVRDGWDAPPEHRVATAPTPPPSPRHHRLRLLPLGDEFTPARDADRGVEREYHPYGLMVWDNPAAEEVRYRTINN